MGFTSLGHVIAWLFDLAVPSHTRHLPSPRQTEQTIGNHRIVFIPVPLQLVQVFLPSHPGLSHMAPFSLFAARLESAASGASNFRIQASLGTHDWNPKFPYAIPLLHMHGNELRLTPAGLLGTNRRPRPLDPEISVGASARPSGWPIHMVLGRNIRIRVNPDSLPWLHMLAPDPEQY
jgi:hypothetical protein